MRVCPSCGVIAPLSRTDCTACGRQFGASPPVVSPRPDGWYWACVLECDFACRGCGKRSPLDSLDSLANEQGDVECRNCGMTQAFDRDQWEDVLAFAQDVADCAGPPRRFGKPPVSDNPYAALGQDKTFAEKTLIGMTSTWLVDSGGKFFALKPEEDGGAPPAHVKGRGLGVAVACSGDTFVVVSKDQATAWSIAAQKELWSRALPAELKLAAPPSKKGLNVQCAALPVTDPKGALDIPLVTGKPLRVDVKTGK